jgi:hypothetical protein
MRVLVCGGRDYCDQDHVWNTLCELDAQRGPFEVVIHGCATGADTEGMIWAQGLGRKHAPFQADWRTHGRAAGPLRNQRMLDEGKPTLVIAFPGGKGTADMVRRAKAAGVEVIAIADRSPQGGDKGTLGPVHESGGAESNRPSTPIIET